MNQRTMTFPTRVDYTDFDEITVKLKLITATTSVQIAAKLDTGSKSRIAVVGEVNATRGKPRQIFNQWLKTAVE